MSKILTPISWAVSNLSFLIPRTASWEVRDRKSKVTQLWILVLCEAVWIYAECNPAGPNGPLSSRRCHGTPFRCTCTADDTLWLPWATWLCVAWSNFNIMFVFYLGEGQKKAPVSHCQGLWLINQPVVQTGEMHRVRQASGGWPHPLEPQVSEML